MFKLCFCNLSYVNICILVEDMNETKHEPSGLCSLVWWDKFLSFHRQISCHTSSLLGTTRSPQRCGSRKWNTRRPGPPSTDPRVNGFLCGLLNNKTGDRIVANLFCPNISRKKWSGKVYTCNWEYMTLGECDTWSMTPSYPWPPPTTCILYICVFVCLHNIASSLCRWGWGDYGQELWPHAWWSSCYSPSTSLTVTSYVTTFSLSAKTIFKGNLPPFSLYLLLSFSHCTPSRENRERLREIIFPAFLVFSFYYFPLDRRQLISEAQLIKEISFFTIGFSY